MKIINRFPSKQDSLKVFLVCAFPIHVWAIILIFYNFPGVIISLTTWDVFGFVAYTLVFTFAETSILFLILTLACVLLPPSVILDSYLANGTILALIISIWFGFLHIPMNFEQIGVAWTIIIIWIWVVTLFAALMFSLVFIKREEKIEIFVTKFAERLIVLSSIYIVLDLISAFILIIRKFT
jgi:hypothetical protein